MLSRHLIFTPRRPVAFRHPVVVAALLALCFCLVLPAGASAFQKAIWGSPTYNGVNQFPMYHQLGVTIDQVDLPWAEVAPTRPKDPTNPNDPAYHWPAEIAQSIAGGRRYGIKVMLQIIGAPAWANGGHSNPSWAPKNPADFAAFATAAAKKYPQVKLWMIWGEPTRAGNFYPITAALPGDPLAGSQLTAPHLYARMLNDAYGALKAVSKRNLVIGGDTYTSGEIDPLQWIENLRLPDGKPPRMDMYGHNPFSYPPGPPVFGQPLSPFDEVQFSDLHELAGWIDTYLRKGMPLFLSEFTIPTQPDDEFNFYADPPVAAQWVTDVLRQSRAWHRIDALGWVNVYDDPPLSYGGLLTQAGVPKPDYYAFEHG
jgi:hypothetical protein